MNDKQRKELAKARAELNVESLTERLGAFRDLVEQMKEDEREKFGNMTEGLQNGEKGQAISEAADTLEALYDQLVTACEALEEAAGCDLP